LKQILNDGLPKVELLQDSSGKMLKVLINGKPIESVFAITVADSIEAAVPIVTMQFFALVERETIADGRDN
jgi:hypothetical protein